MHTSLTCFHKIKRMLDDFIVLQTDVENSKTMLAHTYYKAIPLIAKNLEHCAYLEKLAPLLAAPWFLGSVLFVKSQWISSLIIDDIPIINYSIQPSKSMFKACKYHALIIKSIYEILKELHVITKGNYCYKDMSYFNDVPAWLGLIINDVITYKIHTICVNECLSLNEVKIYHNNIKENLIQKEKNIFTSPIISNQSHNFYNPEQPYEPYTAINAFIELTNFHADINDGFNKQYYQPFKDSYQKYLQSLKAKWWKVTLISETGDVYMHSNAGRLPKNHLKSIYNQILFID